MTTSNKEALRKAAFIKYRDLKQRQYHPKSVLSRYNIAIPIANNRALLFNSVSRSLCLLNESEFTLYTALKNKQDINAQAHIELLNHLAAENFLILPNVNEYKKLQHQFESQRNNRSRLGLTIAPTMGCNLACTYCFQGLNKEQATLSDELISNILHLVQTRINHIHNLTITWYGGEPLMKSNRLFSLSAQLIELCQQKKVTYNSVIVTNGVFLNANTAARLCDHGCKMAQVTIDGPQNIHDRMRPTIEGKGSFLRIMNNIADVLKNTSLPISMRVNVGKDNLATCGELLDDIELRGFHHYSAFSLYFAPIDASTPVSGTAFTESLGQKAFNDIMASYRQRAKKLGIMPDTQSPCGFMGLCVATMRGDLLLAPNGEIHKCWESMHDTEKKIGSFLEKERLTQTQADKQNKKLWDNWTPFDNPICSQCAVLPLCGGKCAQRFVYFGEGGEHSLPCSEWKWNIAELIFERALEKGFVTQKDWLAGYNSIDFNLTGDFHTAKTMANAKDQLYTKVQYEPFVPHKLS